MPPDKLFTRITSTKYINNLSRYPHQEKTPANITPNSTCRNTTIKLQLYVQQSANVAELVDALDLGSSR